MTEASHEQGAGADDAHGMAATSDFLAGGTWGIVLAGTVVSGLLMLCPLVVWMSLSGPLE